MKKINWRSLFERPFTAWPDRALVARAKGLHHAVFVVDCAGTHDLITLDAIEAELERRGYEQQTAGIKFVKREDA